jgi:hypothetical protein
MTTRAALLSTRRCSAAQRSPLAAIAPRSSGAFALHR